MHPIEIHDADFQEKVLDSDRPVLVDFWAPWCGPCGMVAPTLERLAGELTGRLVVAKINTDADARWARQLGVMGIPTLVLFKNGSELDRVVGVQPKWALRAWLEPHLEG